MFKKIAVIFAVLVLTGCVSTETIKLDKNASATMHGKKLALSASDRPDFAAMTAGKAMFAMVGAFAMISTGNEIVRENNIEDPAVYIAKEISEGLKSRHSMNIATSVDANKNDDV